MTLAELKQGGKLAPATVINIYSVASQMLADAEGDGVVERSPLNRRRDRLPRKRDKNPEWRRDAVFKLGELEHLLTTSKAVSDDRRVFYAIMFLAGMRFGEVAALRWRHIDTEVRPLNRLTVARSYNTKLRREKSTCFRLSAGRHRTDDRGARRPPRVGAPIREPRGTRPRPGQSLPRGRQGLAAPWGPRPAAAGKVCDRRWSPSPCSRNASGRSILPCLQVDESGSAR